MNSAPGASQTDSSSTVLAPLAPQKRAVILLVEDECFVREMAAGILEAAGYWVLSARDAADATDVFHEYGPIIEVLITDIVLPARDGYRLAEEMKAQNGNLKVLFVSGYATHMAAGGSFCLAKPFSSATLLHRIEELLRSEPDRVDV